MPFRENCFIKQVVRLEQYIFKRDVPNLSIFRGRKKKILYRDGKSNPRYRFSDAYACANCALQVPTKIRYCGTFCIIEELHNRFCVHC